LPHTHSSLSKLLNRVTCITLKLLENHHHRFCHYYFFYEIMKRKKIIRKYNETALVCICVYQVLKVITIRFKGFHAISFDNLSNDFPFSITSQLYVKFILCIVKCVRATYQLYNKRHVLRQIYRLDFER
jgi:hypothetical protein